MGTGKIITGILIGAAVGAALGILFAPDKGSATRKKISKKAGDFTDSIKEKFNGLVDTLSDTVSEKYEAGKKAAEGTIKKGRKAATS